MVLISVDGVPAFVRIIQNGSDDINRALVSRPGMEPGQAEQIKRHFGLSTQGAGAELRPAFEVIYEATGDLVVAIRNTLSFFLSSRPGSSVERILLSGGDASSSTVSPRHSPTRRASQCGHPRRSNGWQSRERSIRTSSRAESPACPWPPASPWGAKHDCHDQ